MTQPATRILIIEDDAVVRTFLADNLIADGYELSVAATMREGLRALEAEPPDLAVVDLTLPDGSGLELIKRVRAADGIASRIDPTLPVIVLSASAGELRLRIAAVLRRAKLREVRGPMRVGTLEIDPAARAASVRGRRVELAAKEFALLRTLASAPTRVFTKEELLRDVWGLGYRLVDGPLSEA